MEKPAVSAPRPGLPPASHYQRWPLRILNGILRPLNRLGIARARLDESSLIAAARRQSGLRDFGDDSFLEPMRILLDALEREADINPLGRALTRQSLVRLLRNRLLAADLLRRHPEILDRPMPPPVVVVGLARSGTTRLHRLLAADRRFLHLKSWESIHPVPWPDSYGAAVDPRKRNIEQALKAVLYMSPQIAAVHPLGANEVEEEVGLLQHHFSSQIFEVITPVPSFAEWLMTHDQTPAYEYMVKLMKIISWFRDDPPDKPWVLKTPQHMQDLDALMAVFPDARLVFAHRDPVKTVGSICSMAWEFGGARLQPPGPRSGRRRLVSESGAHVAQDHRPAPAHTRRPAARCAVRGHRQRLAGRSGGNLRLARHGTDRGGAGRDGGLGSRERPAQARPAQVRPGGLWPGPGGGGPAADVLPGTLLDTLRGVSPLHALSSQVTLPF